MAKIFLHIGDITQAATDAIVNAANPMMLGGGGVDGAIHRAAGPKLLEACRRVKSSNGIRCPVGESRITIAGKLHAKFVIHSVGPRYKQDPGPERLLSSAYLSALRLAGENNCRSIAFPAISCGAYGYPLDEAAKISLRSCALPEFDSLEVHFYLFDAKTFEVWQLAMADAD